MENNNRTHPNNNKQQQKEETVDAVSGNVQTYSDQSIDIETNDKII